VVLVDLSHPVRTGMPVYPGDPEVDVAPALTVAANGVNVLRLHLGSQSGTHVDAPFHVRDDLPDLDAVPLSRFVGPAVLVDARSSEPRAGIPRTALDPVRDRLRPGVVVLLVTGWSRHWDSPGYLTHPWPSPGLAADLVAAGVRTVGIDALSVDVTPEPGDPSAGLPTHLVLAEAGCVIAENLTGLDPLLGAQAAGASVEVSLLPMRLAGADGAPVRAVATVRPATEPDARELIVPDRIAADRIVPDRIAPDRIAHGPGTIALPVDETEGRPA
jgi:kynurenine formamidase